MSRFEIGSFLALFSLNAVHRHSTWSRNPSHITPKNSASAGATRSINPSSAAPITAPTFATGRVVILVHSNLRRLARPVARTRAHIQPEQIRIRPQMRRQRAHHYRGKWREQIGLHRQRRVRLSEPAGMLLAAALLAAWALHVAVELPAMSLARRLRRPAPARTA
jgi:hypothetical protein